MSNSPFGFVIPPAAVFADFVFMKVMVAYSRGCLLTFSITFPEIFIFAAWGFPCEKLKKEVISRKDTKMDFNFFIDFNSCLKR